MFGLRKRIQKCERQTNRHDREIKELWCKLQDGHKWQFVELGRTWEWDASVDGTWKATFTWTVEAESKSILAGPAYKFRCYRCEQERLFGENNLSPDQRRELEYLGILSPQKKPRQKSNKKGEPK